MSFYCLLNLLESSSTTVNVSCLLGYSYTGSTVDQRGEQRELYGSQRVRIYDDIHGSINTHHLTILNKSKTRGENLGLKFNVMHLDIFFNLLIFIQCLL